MLRFNSNFVLADQPMLFVTLASATECDASKYR
jgi:hypothetical protein